MELLSFGHPHVICQPVATANATHSNKIEYSCCTFKNYSKSLVHKQAGILCYVSRSNYSEFFGAQISKKFHNILYHKERVGSLGLSKGLQICAAAAADDTAVQNYGRNIGVTRIPDKRGAGSLAKVLIPSLPDESNSINPGSPITSCSWEWKPKLTVHYEKAGAENVGKPAVLFLPGFGVGAFHYEKQLKDLGREYRVWALDFLGQGKSLPTDDPAPTDKKGEDVDRIVEFWGFGEESEPWAKELVYSIDLWQEQVREFIEKVIGEPVYVVGNSLGGYVALYFAACNPQLVKGVTLLNATPFWGFLPNRIRSPKLSKLFPWAGTFPLPPTVRKLTEFVWYKISDPRSVLEVLKQVYADHSTKVDNVFCNIIETTQHPAAAAAFASIMFAPQGELSFGDALDRCKQQGVAISLVYGKEDPWVTPFWGHRVKKKLPEVPYYEITPAGHCPHDEVPEVVNFLLRGWIKHIESEGLIMLPLLDEQEHDQSVGISRDLEYTRGGSKQKVRVKLAGSKSSFWNTMRSILPSNLINRQSQ